MGANISDMPEIVAIPSRQAPQSDWFDNRSSRPGGLALTFHEQIAVIWLDRPHKLNAMERGFWHGMRAVLNELADNGCRVAVVAGAGERAFCTGGDVASFEALADAFERDAFQRDCMATFAAVERAAFPIIAAVHGLALGGGTELALACDFAIAAENAQFAMPEIALGLVPGYGVLRAPVIIGLHWTNYLVMTGDRVNARQAQTMGLVQEVVPVGEHLQAALALASRLATRSADAMAAVKRLSDQPTTKCQFEHSVREVSVLHQTEPARAAREAFLKR